MNSDVLKTIKYKNNRYNVKNLTVTAMQCMQKDFLNKQWERDRQDWNLNHRLTGKS